MSKQPFRVLSNLVKTEKFSQVVNKLMIGKINDDDKIYLLANALALLQEYQKDKRCKVYFEFAYYIFLKYYQITQDVQPLLHFSINAGFYPLSYILYEKTKVEDQSIFDCIIQAKLEYYRDHDKILMLEQKNCVDLLLTDISQEKSYIAPTSYGKSSLIKELIKRAMTNGRYKIAIVVPTRSLLEQTYQMIRDAKFDVKLLVHDEMFDPQKTTSFIAIFTQERVARFFDKHNIYFDLLIIDEAHHLLEGDFRARLLSRIIRINKNKNRNVQIVYLSPLIADSNHLALRGEKANIFEKRIKHSIKSPEYILYNNDNKKVEVYNRFFNTFEPLRAGEKDWISYIKCNARYKNYIFVNNPKDIEKVSREIAKNLPTIEDPEITSIVEMLEQYTHPNFYMIDTVKKGVIYLHGNIPDDIKDYLEDRFRQVEKISYLVANTVTLEGVNLPIETMFLVGLPNTFGRNDLVNLIGRVNRLDRVFESKDITKLLPQIHFVDRSPYTPSKVNFQSKIKTLRKNDIRDNITNPLLSNFKEPTKPGEIAKTNLKRKYEELILNETVTGLRLLKKHIVKYHLQNIYANDDECEKQLSNIDSEIEKIRKSSTAITPLDMINVIFFSHEAKYANHELCRLQYSQVRKFYKGYLEHRGDLLSSRINYFVNSFKKRQKEEKLLYVGRAYGEVSKNADLEDIKGGKIYINLSEKNDLELINLAIVRMKMEDNFVSFSLNNCFMFLYELELISKGEYDNMIYGTITEEQIRLIRTGLSLSMINKLQEDKQISNIQIQESGVVHGNEAYKAYFKKCSPFDQFRMRKYILIEE